MNKKGRLNFLSIIVLTCVVLQLTGCRNTLIDTSSNNKFIEKTSNTVEKDNKIVTDEIAGNYPVYNELFTIETVKELKEEQPECDWMKLKSVELDNVGDKKIIVHLLGKGSENNSEIKAFLEYSGKLFGIDIVSNYGIKQVSVTQNDMNNDRSNELVVTGTVGATASVTKIIGYDANRGLWVEWLDAGYTYRLDLDNDGEIEIVSVSQGSVPSYVWIYRWNGTGYSRLDAAAVTGNDYAILQNHSTGYWIEAGKAAESHFYTYLAGDLVEHSKAFAERNDYILPESNRILLSESDIEDLHLSSLDLARNEIYARHGYIFDNEEYRNYFISKPWYKENADYKDSILNSTEMQNAGFLMQYAKKVTACFNKIEGGSVVIDMDGNGIKDEIRLECKPGDNSCKLYVNSLSILGEGNNFDGIMLISDIDTRDKYKEIAITESGPSGDEATYFYYYDGFAINYMGRIEGNQYSIKMTGNGTFTTKSRGKILQTWFYTDLYGLSSSHKLENIKQSFYRMNTMVTVKKQLVLQKSPSEPEMIATLNPGEDIMITLCDNGEWCEVETSKGVKGWFAVDAYDTIRGTSLNASEFFEGLCYAG